MKSFLSFTHLALICWLTSCISLTFFSHQLWEVELKCYLRHHYFLLRQVSQYPFHLYSHLFKQSWWCLMIQNLLYTHHQSLTLAWSVTSSSISESFLLTRLFGIFFGVASGFDEFTILRFERCLQLKSNAVVEQWKNYCNKPIMLLNCAEVLYSNHTSITQQ